MVAQNCHDPGGEADQPDGGETIGLDGEEAGGEEEGSGKSRPVSMKMMSNIPGSTKAPKGPSLPKR